MRNKILIFLFFCVSLLSCDPLKTESQIDPLKQWILENEKQIDLACDSFIENSHKMNKPDPDWSSSIVVFRYYAPTILGVLAAKAGDSTECIVVALTFYKDPLVKKSIMISAEDSTCLNKLNSIILKDDSTGNFKYGKNKLPLY